MGAGGMRNSRIKNSATGFFSRLRATVKTMVAMAAYTQKLCEINASIDNPSHRLRRRVKSLSGIRSAAGRRANAKTIAARIRIANSARMCSGMIFAASPLVRKSGMLKITYICGSLPPT